MAGCAVDAYPLRVLKISESCPTLIVKVKVIFFVHFFDCARVVLCHSAEQNLRKVLDIVVLMETIHVAFQKGLNLVLFNASNGEISNVSINKRYSGNLYLPFLRSILYNE